MTMEPPRPPGDAAAPHRRRRRRRKRGEEAVRERPVGAEAKTAAPPGSSGQKPGPRQGARPNQGRRDRDRRPDRDRARPALPPLVPTVSALAATPVTAEPLAPAEVVEMKHHLAFIRAHKDVLRLKLNAAEDLLVNGQREPSDRGVCRHLLGKIDRTVIESAVGREPMHSNPAARARMLAGAIRLTADASVLLTYLETLTHVRSHAEAAQAFGEIVARLDFESVSASRLGRLLQVLVETFTGPERVQVLFSLLAGAAFARAFDTALPALPPTVIEAFAPLRAVHRRAGGGGVDTHHESAALLRAGVEQLLSAPDTILRGYAEPLRIAILELALDDVVPPDVTDRAAGVLLASLPRTDRTYTHLVIRRAAQLLGRHADDRARAVLEDLRRAQPGFQLAERWLTALDARRLGRIALRGAPGERGRLVAGFWLDAQRPVWIRTAPATDADRLAHEAALQRELTLPGLATVVEHGVTSGIAYVAVMAPGQPLRLPEGDGAESPTGLAIAAAAVRILYALALAGATLPDAEPERFLITPESAALTLADLDGAERSDPARAAGHAHALARAFVERFVPERATRRLPPAAAAALHAARAEDAALAALARALDDASLWAPDGFARSRRNS